MRTTLDSPHGLLPAHSFTQQRQAVSVEHVGSIPFHTHHHANFCEREAVSKDHVDVVFDVLIGFGKAVQRWKQQDWSSSIFISIAWQACGVTKSCLGV